MSGASSSAVPNCGSWKLLKGVHTNVLVKVASRENFSRISRDNWNVEGLKETKRIIQMVIRIRAFISSMNGNQNQKR